MIRVLHMVAPAVSDSNGHRGVNGPELRTLNALKYISTRGISNIISYSSEGLLWDKFNNYDFPLVNFHVRSKYHFKSIWKIVLLINQYKIDVIHTQGPASLDLFATIAAKITGKKVIVTRPSMINDLQLKPFWRHLYRTIDQFTLRNADKIIAVSSAGFNYLLNNEKLNKDRIKLIYNGVDLIRFNNNRVEDYKRFGLPHDALVVGACAQLTPAKGWEDFVNVVRILHARMPDVKGMIVGDGPLRKSIEKQVHDLGLTNTITFTGYLDDVESALKCMDLFLLMSKREGLSVAVIEAMASKLPCVITKVGGAMEQVQNGINGFVVQTSDIKNAAEKVIKILSDNNLRISMGKEGRRICEQKFKVNKMAHEYLSVYKELGKR